MRNILSRGVLLIGILIGMIFTADIGAETAIVNARPLLNAAMSSAEYMTDVDSGIMDYLFDRGFIIFSQTTEDPVEKLIAVGKETGADIIINWSLDLSGLSGALIDCRTGEQTPERTVPLEDFEDTYGNQHDMYAAMGVRLGEELLPDSLN